MANGPVRHTKQKDAVMAQLRGCDDFISAQELHRKLVDSGLRIGLATVYRQLNSLVDSGAADTVRMDGQQLFRLCGDDAHHHHLVCRKCGKTIRRANPGCARWPTGMGSRWSRIPLRCSAYAPIVRKIADLSADSPLLAEGCRPRADWGGPAAWHSRAEEPITTNGGAKGCHSVPPCRHSPISCGQFGLEFLEVGEDFLVALLAGVEGEVAEGALVTFAVLVAGVHAGLALALLGGAVLAVGVVVAVTGDAAAVAKADRAFGGGDCRRNHGHCQ